MNTERDYKRFIGTRYGHQDFHPRSMRQASPAERFAAIEAQREPVHIGDRLVAAGMIVCAIAGIVLLVLERLGVVQ